MYNKSHSESFVIQVEDTEQRPKNRNPRAARNHDLNQRINFSSMKVFNRFRKIFMGLLFPYRTFRNHRSSRGRNPGSSFPRRRSCDRPEPPKNSCSSSYYSSNSHYDEAISDCIEFFNKSSREGALDTKTSGFMV
ncbi:hypothetical protein DCAR_0520080 [Daucus carota subsp. sativus]|uniref:Uncharacterized protein n=1 Tax=Daucus carota subsp. sativus TaxID=79200 RepID=A0A162A0F1_DAUCS|nr:hypothetical protein DCAR_0520080 [Daucus carota subsp. sativus]